MFIGYGDLQESQGIRLGDRVRVRDEDLIEGIVIGIYAAREDTFFDEDDNEILEDIVEVRTDVNCRRSFPISKLEAIPRDSPRQGQMRMEFADG